MPTYTVKSLKALNSVLNKHLKIKKKRIREVLKICVRELKPYMRNKVPKAFKELKDSIVIRHKGTVSSVQAQAPHAEVVEIGARPHWPPLQPIIDWVKVKGLASTDSEAYPIAKGVAKKIAEQGTPPHWYGLNTAKLALELLPGLIMVALEAQEE